MDPQTLQLFQNYMTGQTAAGNNLGSNVQGGGGPATLANSPFFDNLQNMGQNYFSYAPQTNAALSNLTGEIQGQNQSVLAPLLADVDTSTAQNQGNISSLMQQRGLAGPGQTSTMETSALNQAGLQGTQEKAGLQSNFLQNQANELTSALGTAYGAANTGAETGASAYNNLLGMSNTNVNNLGNMLENIWQTQSGYGNAQTLQNMQDTTSTNNTILSGILGIL